MTTLDLIRRTIPRPVRNVLRRPGASAFWFWRETLYRFGHSASARVSDDWRLPCHPTSVEPFETFRVDPDSAAELAAFRAHVGPDMVFFDLGAHHGFFSLAALKFGGPGTRVVAVDASRPVVRVLKENVALNGATDRVRVIEAAVGAAPGVLRMISSGAGGWNYFHGVDGDRPDATAVTQVTLHGLADQTGLIPTHVKIDVEGFEGEVLSGGRDLLRSAGRPVVFLELHGKLLRARGKDPLSVLSQLSAFGYPALLHHDRPVSPADAARADVIRLVCPPG